MKMKALFPSAVLVLSLLFAASGAESNSGVGGSGTSTTTNSAAAAAPSSSSLLRRKNRNLQSGNYEPWDLGTGVYYYEDGVGYWGEIKSYNPDNGQYTIQWKDDPEGETEIYDDTDDVDELVEDAAFVYYNGEDADWDDPWVAGTTQVYAEEDGVAYWGKITALQRGKYTITWDDGEVEYYNRADEDLDDMVYAAYEKVSNNDQGDNFDPEEAEHNFLDQEYQVGTVVAKADTGGDNNGNGVVMGKITAFDETTKTYTIEWNNSQTEQVSDNDLIHDYVANAWGTTGLGGRGSDNKQQQPAKGRRSGGATFGILVVVAAALVAAVAGAVLLQRKIQNEKELDGVGSDLDLGRSTLPGRSIT